MKILVLMLCFIAAQQCLPWEASRILTEAEGNQAFIFFPRRLLLEADDEGDGMEADIILPDASDGAKSEILIKEEKQRSSKQEEDLVMEAIEELISKEKQLKNQGDKLILSNVKENELPSNGGKEEKRVGDEAKKEREKDGAENVSTDNERSDMLLQEKLQEESDKKVKIKKQASKIDRNLQPTKDEKNFDADGEFVQEFSDKVPPLRSTGEHNMGDSLLGTGEGEKSVKLSGKMEDKGVKATKKAEKRKREVKEKGGFSSKLFDIETTKSIGDGFEEGLLETKERSGDKVKGSRSKQSDADGLAGSKMMQISNEETPADLVERESQGGLEEWTTTSAKERKGGEDKEKPWKKMKSQKKSKVQVLQEADSGLTGFDATEYQTKRTKTRDFQTDVKERSDVSITETPGLMLEQADLEGTSESQMKKKKKVKSDRLKEEKSYVNDVKNFDKIEENSDKANEEFRKKVATNGKYSPRQGLSSKNVEKVKKLSTTDETEEGYPNSKSDNGNRKKDKEELKTLEVIDPKHASTAKSKVMQQVDENENNLKGGQHRLSTNVNKEERLDQKLQSMTAKKAQERAEASRISNTAGSSIGVDEEEDEYSDFMQDFSEWSMKFQDTAYKVADHLGPNLQKLTDTSKTYFNKANQQITESFSPLVGKQFAPFFASLLSYGLLLVPLVVVIILFEHIRAMLSLQKVLLFVNIYLAAYFATLLLATFIMGEPMTFFYKSSANGYVHLQLLQALGYITYLILQTIDLASSCSSEACSIKVTVVLQWFVAVVIGFHYYVTVFHRAMVSKGPHTNWKIYGIYSSAFVVLCLFARIKRVKKGYVHVGQPDTDKKH